MNPYVPVTQLEQVTHGQSLPFGPFGSRSMKPLHIHLSLTPWLSQQSAKLGLPEALCRARALALFVQVLSPAFRHHSF